MDTQRSETRFGLYHRFWTRTRVQNNISQGASQCSGSPNMGERGFWQVCGKRQSSANNPRFWYTLWVVPRFMLQGPRNDFWGTKVPGPTGAAWQHYKLTIVGSGNPRFQCRQWLCQGSANDVPRTGSGLQNIGWTPAPIFVHLWIFGRFERSLAVGSNTQVLIVKQCSWYVATSAGFSNHNLGQQTSRKLHSNQVQEKMGSKQTADGQQNRFKQKSEPTIL